MLIRSIDLIFIIKKIMMLSHILKTSLHNNRKNKHIQKKRQLTLGIYSLLEYRICETFNLTTTR